MAFWTLQAILESRYEASARCPCGRSVTLDAPALESLIVRHGPDKPLPEIMKRAVCSACKRKLSFVVRSKDAPRFEWPVGYGQR